MIKREHLMNRIYKGIEKATGLTREFIETHSIWELEERLGIGHYKICGWYKHRNPCGCVVWEWGLIPPPESELKLLASFFIDKLLILE